MPIAALVAIACTTLLSVVPLIVGRPWQRYAVSSLGFAGGCVCTALVATAHGQTPLWTLAASPILVAAVAAAAEAQARAPSAFVVVAWVVGLGAAALVFFEHDALSRRSAAWQEFATMESTRIPPWSYREVGTWEVFVGAPGGTLRLRRIGSTAGYGEETVVRMVAPVCPRFLSGPGGVDVRTTTEGILIVTPAPALGDGDVPLSTEACVLGASLRRFGGRILAHGHPAACLELLEGAALPGSLCGALSALAVAGAWHLRRRRSGGLEGRGLAGLCAFVITSALAIYALPAGWLLLVEHIVWW